MGEMSRGRLIRISTVHIPLAPEAVDLTARGLLLDTGIGGDGRASSSSDLLLFLYTLSLDFLAFRESLVRGISSSSLSYPQSCQN